MPKGKPRDPHKELHWRQLLLRCQHSGLSIADFCRRHRLAPASFYAWRRTLLQRDQPGNDDTHPPTVTFLPLSVCADTPPSAVMLELVLGNGRLLRIPAGCDPSAVRALLAVLEEPPC
jgi:hypothetical protein